MALAVTSAIKQQINSPALDIRRFVSAGMQEGVVGITDMAVAQRGAGANYSVDIGSGEALVRGDIVTNQALEYSYNDATFNLTGFTAAHATLPRIDRVTLRMHDQFHGDADNVDSFQIVTGTATSGATLVNLTGAGAVPNSSLLLANILIPATATTITTANIDTTVRVRSLTATLSQIGQSGATTGQYAQWNGTAWIPATISTALQLDYAPVTSSPTSTATTAATATAVVTGAAVAYDGATPVMIEFFCPSITNSVANQNASFNLYDGSTDLGQMCRTWATTTGGGYMIVFAKTQITPSAATHTYSIRAWNSAAGTITCNCGAGGAGVDRPMYMKITRAA